MEAMRVAKVWDALGSSQFTIRARAFVNATGPWSDSVRTLEVVAFGEIEAPTEWVKASKDLIKFLNNDDGAVCANWD